MNLAKLRRLAPTHVLVNVDENRRETVEAIRAWGAAAPEIVVTHPIAIRRQPGAGRSAGARSSAACRASPSAPPRCAPRSPRELAATRADGRPQRRVLYLIWHDPWMTVARDTYLSRMLARIGWQTLPEPRAATPAPARYPALDRRRALARRGRAGAAQLRAVRASSDRHVAAAQALCPAARVQRVDGELLSWYGARAVAGPALSARAGATTMAAPCPIAPDAARPSADGHPEAAASRCWRSSIRSA